MSKSKMTTIIRILKYIKKYLPLLLVCIALSIVIVAVALYVPLQIGNAIDLIIGKNNVDFDNVKIYLFKVLIAIVIGAICQWITASLNNVITCKIVRDIRQDAFKKITVLPLSYIDTHQTGDIVSKVITDVESFADGLLMGFTQFFTGVLTILGTLTLMFIKNWIIALVVVLITPISIVMANFISKRTYKMFKLQSQTRGEQTSYIEQMISNEKVVKAFCYENNAITQFDEINDKLEKYSLKATFFSSLVNPSTRVINNVVYALIVLVGGLTVISSGGLTVGALSCLLSYANQYAKPFNEISGVITELQNAIACAERVFELIDEKAVVTQNPNAITLTNVKGNVKLNNVCFSYDKSKTLLNNVNLNVERGERIAIVGPTGCGKTTLINLLMAFYDVDKGSICVDKVNIQNVTRNSLRENFGMVLQDTWLKSGTIRENIVMGKKDATDEQVLQASKLAHSYGFIKKLPNGFDTVIGEDGGVLSQGQKQLLCITRVMLALPPMLILDEATSSIDTRTEIKIQDAFDLMMNGRTSFIVAHRLSTIKNADQILVMRNGNIVEQGKHYDLLKQNGFYAKLYNSQFAK